jgi:hypothetical protein
MAILSVGIGMGINLVLPDASGIELDAITEEIPSALEIVSLAALVVIFALSLLRQGPRGFLGQVLSPYGDDDDDGHGHGHGHDDDGHGHGHGHGHDREGGSGCC